MDWSNIKLQTIILAGGLGTRISEETTSKPKPMVMIDHKPIVWHVMKIYAANGFTRFVVATGYKSEVIEEWVGGQTDGWQISTLFTGESTQTGGRVRQSISSLTDELFFLTYGDGLGNINIRDLYEFHTKHGKIATVTAVRPPARFGHLDLDGSLVMRFGEKSQLDVGWINGGFFVLNRKIADFIASDDEPFETGALPRLVEAGELMAFQHRGFWFPMDTRSEKITLSNLAKESPPPWLNFERTTN